MEHKLKRQEVLNALKTVINAADAKEGLIAGTDSFVFAGDYVCTYNNSLSFSYPLVTGITCTVRAAETLKVIEKMKGAEIKFKEGKDHVEVSDGTTTLKMKLVLNDEEIRKVLETMELDDAQWKKLPKDFMNGVELCSYSVGRNEDSKALNGMAFDGNEVWSSDNLRISMYEMDDGLEEGFMIPYQAVQVLMKLSQPPAQYCVQGGWAHFLCESGVSFSANLMYEEFPIDKFRRVIESYEDGGETYLFPDGLEKALGVAEVLSSETEDYDVAHVIISRKGKKLIVKGEKSCGSVEDKVDFEGKMFEEGISIRIPPSFLKTIFSVTRKFTMNGEIVQFKTDNFTHLLTVARD